MSLIFPIRPMLNVPLTLASLSRFNRTSMESKRIGYSRKNRTVWNKERCPEKRAAYLQELAEVQASGKSIV